MLSGSNYLYSERFLSNMYKLLDIIPLYSIPFGHLQKKKAEFLMGLIMKGLGEAYNKTEKNSGEPDYFH